MFGINKKTISSVGEIETIIGKDTIFKGNISGKGTIRIDGQFEGDISTTGNVMIGGNAKITAKFKALNATIAGIVYGNIDISERLELLPSGQIYGDIKAGVLIISEGATFQGTCEMQQSIEQVVFEPKEAI
jgi:cytoskeletal protein CcmA (bactofilin family)